MYTICPLIFLSMTKELPSMRTESVLSGIGTEDDLRLTADDAKTHLDPSAFSVDP